MLELLTGRSTSGSVAAAPSQLLVIRRFFFEGNEKGKDIEMRRMAAPWVRVYDDLKFSEQAIVMIR